MNPRNAMLSVLQLFGAFSFFTAAIFFFSLPFLPKVRLKISDALLAAPNVCHEIGAFLMASSLVLIGGFYFLSRGRSIRISMGGNPITIETAALSKSVEECLKRHFGGQIAFTDLTVIRGGKLEIEVSLAPSIEKVREELFVDVEKQLVPLLEEKFGYAKPFGLTFKTPYSEIRNP